MLRYSRHSLEKCVTFADLLVCAVLVPGARAPILVTRDMVRSMKPGSVIIDYSIDQGGCVETTRLTPQEDFIYTEEGVIHFAVPNVPSFVSRTATHALTNAVIFYLKAIVDQGPKAALRGIPALRRGLYTYNGQVVNPNLVQAELPFADAETLLSAQEQEEI